MFFEVSTDYFLEEGRYIKFKKWDAQQHLGIEQLADIPKWNSIRNQRYAVLQIQRESTKAKQGLQQNLFGY